MNPNYPDFFVYTAQKIRKKLNIYGAFDFTRLTKIYPNLTFTFGPLPEGTYGIYTPNNTNIHLNNTMTKERQRLGAALGLGARIAQISTKQTISTTSIAIQHPTTQGINRFVMELLLPRNELYLFPIDVHAIAQRYAVSESFTAVRIQHI